MLASSRLFLCNGFLAFELIAYPTNNKYTLAMWHSSCCATFNAFKTATLAVAKTERVRGRRIEVGVAHTHTHTQEIDSLLLHFPRVPVPVRTRPKPVAVAQQLAG